MNESKQSPKIKTKENLFINLGFNILIPILILRKGDDWLGESLGNLTNTHANSTLVSSILLAIAIFFPIAYGLYDFVQRKKCNLLSVLGVISAFLTGGIGQVDP